MVSTTTSNLYKGLTISGGTLKSSGGPGFFPESSKSKLEASESNADSPERSVKDVGVDLNDNKLGLEDLDLAEWVDKESNDMDFDDWVNGLASSPPFSSVDNNLNNLLMEFTKELLLLDSSVSPSSGLGREEQS